MDGHDKAFCVIAGCMTVLESCAILKGIDGALIGATMAGLGVIATHIYNRSIRGKAK